LFAVQFTFMFMSEMLCESFDDNICSSHQLCSRASSVSTATALCHEL